LAAGAEVVSARAEGRAVIASVVMWSDDVLDGENKDPEEIVRDVRIPCDALTLGGAGDEDEKEESEVFGDGDAGDEAHDAVWWWTRGARRKVQLRAWPRAHAPAVTISTAYEGEQLFFFRQVGERRGWLRVTRGGAGARVTGWIRRGALERRDEMVVGRSTMCTGRHGPGMGGRGGFGGHPPRIRYKGPARLRIGARIETSEGYPFGTVKQDVSFGVVLIEGAVWAEVSAIPGVHLPEWEAMMVDVADVILPE